MTFICPKAELRKLRLHAHAHELLLQDVSLDYGVASAVAGFFLVMIAVYFLYIYNAGRELAKLPYFTYRLPNIGVKLQVHIQLVMAAISFLCIIFMWYVTAISAACWAGFQLDRC